MWHAFSLRTRILLSYGIGLVIMTLLIIGLIFWLYSTREQLRQLNNTVAVEAQMGAQMAARTARVEQAVNLYLQQPDETKRAEVENLFSSLSADIQAQSTQTRDLRYQQHLNTLSVDLKKYQDTVLNMIELLDYQKELRYSITLTTFDSVQKLNQILLDLLNSSSAIDIETFLRVQDELQTANLAVNRSITEQDPQIARNSITGYELVRSRLSALNISGDRSINIPGGVEAVTQAISITTQLATNLTDLQSIREARLGEQARTLQKTANSVAEDALKSFTQQTDQLERQAFLAQQVIGVALLGTLILALVIGVQLARTLTQPLVALSGAIQQVNQGDYQQVVSVQDRGELGSLVAAFNTMTSTLNTQRIEVIAQQKALESHNIELSTTLTQLQESIAQREKLALTVRSMSVPIIPILDRVIVIPLVGDLDEQRAQILQQRTLDGVVAYRARTTGYYWPGVERCKCGCMASGCGKSSLAFGITYLAGRHTSRSGPGACCPWK